MPRPRKPSRSSKGGAPRPLDLQGSPPSTATPTGARALRLQRLRGMIDAQQYTQAWGEVEPLLRVDSRDRDLLLIAARVHHGLGLHGQVLAFCARAAAAGLDAPWLHLRGEAHRNLGRTDEALADFANAARLDPRSLDAPLGAIAALEEGGRIAQARAALTALTEAMRSAGTPPTPKHRFEDARLLIHERQYTQAIELIDDLLRVIPPGFKQRRMTLQLRVKACDRSGDFAGAWEAAQRALAEERVEFDPAAYTRQTDALIDYWTRERVKRVARSQEGDPTAIFIAGMPRSGTSLLEQVIAAHPQGAGVGELRTLEPFLDQATQEPLGRQLTHAAREYLAQIRGMHPHATRIVNKSLFNDRLALHLSVLFPSTRIVHVQRDPRDVAVSCVLGGFNLQRLPWTARPEWVAHAWVESARLMRHWQGVLSVPIMHVQYEEFVQTGGPAFAALLQHAGLAWDESVMRFHAKQRTVQTLSYDQVNQPLYTSAVGRWRHYAPQLAGISWPAFE